MTLSCRWWRAPLSTRVCPCRTHTGLAIAHTCTCAYLVYADVRQHLARPVLFELVLIQVGCGAPVGVACRRHRHQRAGWPKRGRKGGGRVGAAESRTQAQHLPAYGRITRSDIAATGRTGSAEDEMVSRTLPMATPHVKISRQRTVSAILWKLQAPAGLLLDIVFISL